MRAVLLLAALVFAGCLEPAGPAPSPTPSPGAPEPVALREIDHGSSSGFEEEARLVFTAEEEWAAFWSRHAPDRERPSVDFAAETVVAATLGPRPNSCWSVRITGAQAESDGKALVEVTTLTPPPDRACAQFITYPAHVVALEGAGWTVSFEDSSSSGAPGG